jgi:hypothetical protein
VFIKREESGSKTGFGEMGVLQGEEEEKKTISLLKEVPI